MSSSLRIKDKSDAGTLIKVAPFRKEIRKTEPHKHNSYFEIVFLSKGKGIHQIDNKNYPIQPPVVFFIRKEQMHNWNITHSPDGYVLILKKTFVEKSLDHELKKLLATASSISCLQIQHEPAITGIFHLLTAENLFPQEANFTVLEGLLKALLAKILESALPYNRIQGFKQDLFESFREMLQHHPDVKNNVAYYARLLHTSPQNLNAACRKAVNQSSAEILAERIIAEAKRLLYYTDNTISEISLMMDFNDPSHFIKYFKRHTGITPKAFRTG
jgi:AraC family transcriptional activator of pobA